jgi:hypothetical protein
MKIVPRLLSFGQKEPHLAICCELKVQTKNYLSFISTIITGGESWIYGYKPERKQQLPSGRCNPRKHDKFEIMSNHC